MPVTMTCMTTKKKFEVDDPPVVELKNGRYAYRCECPWEGKNGKKLVAFKFCSKDAFLSYSGKSEHVPARDREREDDGSESEHSQEGEHSPRSVIS